MPQTVADACPEIGGGAGIGFTLFERDRFAPRYINAVFSGVDPADTEFFFKESVNRKQGSGMGVAFMSLDVKFAVFVEPVGFSNFGHRGKRRFADENGQGIFGRSKFISGKFQMFFQFFSGKLVRFAGDDYFDIAHAVFCSRESGGDEQYCKNGYVFHGVCILSAMILSVTVMIMSALRWNIVVLHYQQIGVTVTKEHGSGSFLIMPRVETAP